jgi:protein TonB
MGIQCFLFTSDEEIAGTIRLVLAGLEVQGEFCSEAVAAAERIANQSFQIVIIDWDNQPEAELLLTTARQRKAAERPITLAIVSDDASVPKALQAGANSILRKPIVVNQAKDTLMTARDLLRSKREPGAAPLMAKQAAAGTSNAPAHAGRTNLDPGKEKTLRAGEFLHSATTAPGGSFETDSDVAASMHEAPPEPADPLADLEPVASSVAEKKSAAPEPPASAASDGPRGLEWYLKNRGISRPSAIVPNSDHAAAAAPAPAPEKPELLGYEQAPSHPASESTASLQTPVPSIRMSTPNFAEQKGEAERPAYGAVEEEEKEETTRRSYRPGKGTWVVVVVFAAVAIAAIPRAPWHPQMQVVWARAQRSLHTWLYPQPVTPVQAPAAHENFARAGDEYKLPAVEAIPDATTDPSQIQVVPVVDPTKKPTGDVANPAAAPADGTAVVSPGDPSQAPALPSPGDPATQNSTSQTGPQQPASQQTSPQQSVPQQPVPQQSVPQQPAPQQSAAPQSVPAVAVPSGSPGAVTPVHTSVVPQTSVAPLAPSAAKAGPVRAPSMPEKIPSSLKSQLAPNSPDPTGPKSPDTSLPSIEPVAVAEGAERALLVDQPAIAFPANVKNQQGTVVLQVLIGRDGTVQDAKFLQGSLAFARTAIDGVKQWKFKPYTMNGRAVSVQALLTLTFKPGA